MHEAYPVVSDYQDVLAAAHCRDLRCRHPFYRTYFAELDAVLFDRRRRPISSFILRSLLDAQPTPSSLATAENDIARRDFRAAFRVYRDDFRTNANSARTPDLDRDGDTARVQGTLGALAGGPASAATIANLVAIAERHLNETGPLVYLGAALIERGCTAKALRIYQAIPYLRPTVPFSYNGVDATAMRLALSINPNAFRAPLADRPPRALLPPPQPH